MCSVFGSFIFKVNLTIFQAIELNRVPEPEAGTLCMATGWGGTEEGGMFLASNLQKVPYP